MAELTTQLRRPLGILWLPLCRINKLGYTTREDYCDPLYLWDISAQPMQLPRQPKITISPPSASRHQKGEKSDASIPNEITLMP